MNTLRWARNHIGVLSLVATIIIGFLTVREARRISTSQTAIVSGFSSQYSEVELEDDRIIALIVCRTELYISNRGGSEARVEILQSRFTPNFFPNLKPVEIDLVSTVQHHLDIASLKSSGVPMLVAFHNWGQEPPALDELFNFYKTSGLELLDEAKLEESEPVHLVYLGSPVVYGQRMEVRESVLVMPYPITIRGFQQSGYSFLDRRPSPVLLGGYRLENLTVDHVVLYAVKPEQQNLMSTQQEGVRLNFAAHFMGKGRSSHTTICSTPGSLIPVF